MKHFKKPLSLLLCMALLCALLPHLSLAAHASVHTGYCGGEGDGRNLTWSLDTETGVLAIEGSGKMCQLQEDSGAPWFEEREYIKKVTIGDGVSSISDCAFTRCPNLSDITIPGSVTSIGNLAFSACTGLTRITVASDNNDYSSDNAGVLFNKDKTRLILCPCGFSGSYAIPDSVTSIGDMSFFQCAGLTSVSMGSRVAYIGASAFCACKGLTDINIPDSVTTIETEAFHDCLLLSSVTIPEKTTYIGGLAFTYCLSLTGITVASENPNYSSDSSGVLFNKEKTELIQAPCAMKGSYEVPDTVTDIKWFAFYGCKKLTAVKIPASVISIESSAFDSCVSLASVIIPESVESIEYYVFYNCPNLTIYGYAESTAEVYAAENEIPFKALDPASGFCDVSTSAYYYQPMLWAVENGITNGTSDVTFGPKKTCTRGQVVTFLWRAYGCPEPTATNHPFTDVKSGAYYYKAMLWAVENGITTGTSATTFGPNKDCTRGQVVTFLWRAAGSPEPESDDCPFTDVKTTATNYKAILWAVENGITNGTSPTTFSPNKTCTRGQVVTFLYNALAG